MVGAILEALDLVIERQFDRLLAQVGLDDRGHLLVERREDLRRALDHRREEAALMKILGDLETDVPASDHHRPPRSRFAEGRHDAIEVGDIAQDEDALRFGAGDPRPHRLGARGQQ